MIFNHVCFYFLLIIDLYFSIPAIIAHIFNPTAKLAIPIGIPTTEVKSKTEAHLVIAKVKISKYSI